MKFEIKLFNFYGTPVSLKLWFLLLFAWLDPTYVVAIFFSVLIHELAHGYVAQKLGYYVSKIYVDILNGAAEMNLSQIHERDSIKIIVAGPLSNLFLLLISILSYTQFKNVFIYDMMIVNLLLLVFNILPIFPLDGGRIFRDSMYLIIKNRAKSAKVSAIVSLVFSVVLLIFSIYTSGLIIGLFSLIFIYFACKELGLIR